MPQNLPYHLQLVELIGIGCLAVLLTLSGLLALLEFF